MKCVNMNERQRITLDTYPRGGMIFGGPDHTSFKDRYQVSLTVCMHAHGNLH